MENRDRQFYFMRAVKDSTKEFSCPVSAPLAVVPIPCYSRPLQIVNGTAKRPTEPNTDGMALDELFCAKARQDLRQSPHWDPGGCKLESPFVILFGSSLWLLY